ncbi:MAG TPA: DUF664 domain-containing protein [Actinopolymorphaceae bacterium]
MTADAAGLRRPHPPTTMTLGGLLKHVAGVEDRNTARNLTGRPIGPPWNFVDPETDPESEWRSAADDSPEELYGLWTSTVARSRAAMSELLASGDVDQSSKLVLPSGESSHLRRIVLDMIEHDQRHTGHADLLREAVDGRVGEDPPQE